MTKNKIPLGETTIETCTGLPDDVLEKYRPVKASPRWKLVASGFWSEDTYHGGHIAYYLAKTADGTWIMDGVRRNAELDDVSEEDVAAGRLNDDQIQAMWGMSLEEAQDQEYRRIVAVCLKAPRKATTKDMAILMYDAIRKAGRSIIDDPDEDGLLSL
jgi:hypothetical protein